MQDFQDLLDGSSSFSVPIVLKNVNIFDVQNVESKHDVGFLLYVQSISGINKGSRGRYFVNILEVPKMAQKVLQYVPKPQLTFLST